jgi:hypothetical protein
MNENDALAEFRSDPAFNSKMKNDLSNIEQKQSYKALRAEMMDKYGGGAKKLNARGSSSTVTAASAVARAKMGSDFDPLSFALSSARSGSGARQRQKEGGSTPVKKKNINPMGNKRPPSGSRRTANEGTAEAIMTSIHARNTGLRPSGS